jgi:acyl-coenzyme A synthetase/AMP-(fatty) acid ligase
MYTPSELQHQLQGAGAIYLVTIAGLADKALEAANGTGVKHVFVFGDDAPPGTAPFKTLLADEHAPAPKVAIDPKRDVVVLPYSSGTTGLPKVCSPAQKTRARPR